MFPEAYEVYNISCIPFCSRMARILRPSWVPIPIRLALAADVHAIPTSPEEIPVRLCKAVPELSFRRHVGPYSNEAHKAQAVAFNKEGRILNLKESSFCKLDV